MPNMIAYGALLGWPVVSLFLYLMMPAARATIWTIIAGFLLLPMFTSFDFPGLPSFDKQSIPSLTALLLAPVMARSGEFRWPRSGIVTLLLLAYVLVPVATGLTNRDPIVIGSTVLPGMGVRETVSAVWDNVIEVMPFLLGAALLGNEKGHRELLLAMVLAALAYSLPVLLEIRLSPFLNRLVYGIASDTYFVQQIRGDGFRAMVFLGHGLLISIFLAMAIIAALALARMRTTLFAVPAWLLAGYLFVVLVFNKSIGALLLVLLIAPLFMLLPARRFLAVAAACALLLMAYPLLRSASTVVLDDVTAMAGRFSPERAQSLKFRLDNEDMLLDRALQKPLFGWGTYGRNQVIVVGGGGTANRITESDGSWIIALGFYGIVGYAALFGLLTYPIWKAFRARRMALPLATQGLVAMHLLNLLDLVPNASLRPMTWLAAGALVTYSVAALRRRGRPARSAGRRAPAPGESVPVPQS